MEETHKIIILRMYNKKLIGGNCKSIQLIAKLVNWDDLRKEYGIKQGFKSYMRPLFGKFIENRGDEVLSLNKNGFKLALGLITENFDKWKKYL